MENTIERVPHNMCTGCGACYNKCPVNAIEMKEDGRGFLSPVVNADICTQCGQCSNHCPVLNMDYIRQYKVTEPDCYAMMADEELRKKSSSGGMFTILAEYVLSKNGIVCGAAYSEDYTSVQHMIVDSSDKLSALRGSKYVQSDTAQTYKTAEKHLETGGWVLYTGTPCQIAGLRRYLKKEYDHLILVDIICHSVPSPKAYKEYIKEKAISKKLVRSDFREKSHFGWGTATSFFFDDGSTYRGNCYRDEYWRAFLGGLSTRKCCGTCEYADTRRIGDFTIGDFWGVGELDKTCDDGKGTSLVLVNSCKAKKLIEAISSDCCFLKKMDYKDVIELGRRRNCNLIAPTPTHWGSDRFFELLNTKPFTVAFDYAFNAKYDVGVTGWWFGENYGGTLTYFALNNVLSKMGLSVLMIAKCSWDPNYKPNETTIPYRFAKKHYAISKNYTPDTIHLLSNHCKAFVSGSDQLFNPTLWFVSGPEYFLNYAKRNNNLISYASSFGNEFYDQDNLRVPMGYWLRRFDSISVRESYAVDICKEQFGLDAKKVMDPVFLCDVKEYEKLAEQSGLKKDNNYLLSFILDPNDAKRNAILHLSKQLDLSYVNLIHAMDFEKNEKLLGLDNIKSNADIEEWLFYYKNADFVITDSFHGTCFAIIFRKKFISIANYQRGANRFISLLEEAGLINRLVKDISEIGQRPDLFEDIDYEQVYATLNPKIAESFQWLKNAIENKPAKEASEFNSLNYEIERIADKQQHLFWKEHEHTQQSNQQEAAIRDLQERLHYLEQENRQLSDKLYKLLKKLSIRTNIKRFFSRLLCSKKEAL